MEAFANAEFIAALATLIGAASWFFLAAARSTQLLGDEMVQKIEQSIALVDACNGHAPR